MPLLDIDWVAIPASHCVIGGDFHSDDELTSDEYPPRRVWLSEYAIMKTPVTVSQWRTFIEETNYSWDAPAELDDLCPSKLCPIIRVSWFDCQAFVEWLNRRWGNRHALPTEAQWEKACRGPTNESYPWLATDEVRRNEVCVDLAIEFQHTFEVESHPELVTSYGCHDMWCNVAEWCQDWHSDGYESLCEQLIDPQGAESGVTKVVRGGGPHSSGFPVCMIRGNMYPSKRDCNIGFRLVRKETELT